MSAWQMACNVAWWLLVVAVLLMPVYVPAWGKRRG